MGLLSRRAVFAAAISACATASMAGAPLEDMYLERAEIRLEDEQTPTEDARFGNTVVTVPGYAFVTAPLSDESAPDGGDVFLYRVDVSANPALQFVKRLDRFGAAAGNAFFGMAIAADGDWAAVAQANEPAVALYERNQGGSNNWGLVTAVLPPENRTYREEAFGGTTKDNQSVDINGDLLIVGDYRGDRYTVSGSTGFENQAGFAFIFERNEGGPNNWGLVARLEDPTRDKNDNEDFGRAVAIVDGVDEDLAFVSAPLTNLDGLTLNVGEVFIFRREAGSTQWEEFKTLVGQGTDGRQDADAFGRSMDLNGKLLVVGTETGAHEADEQYAGSAHIFYQDAGGPNNWGEVGEFYAGDELDGYSEELQLTDNQLIVGASRGGPGGRGAVYIYSEDSGGHGVWGLEQELRASDPARTDRFGAGVALLGGTVIVGDRARESSDGETLGAGSTYIFFKDMVFSGAFESP